MSAYLASIPYARFLGLTAAEEDGVLTVTMPFSEHLIGNPFPPKLHGGATAAMLELTAMAQVAAAFPRATPPRPINVTISYLRPGRPAEVYARASISRAGRRVAHVSIEAWQTNPEQPIATMTAHFQMADGDS